MSQSFNQHLVDCQNELYAKERGEIEVLKVKTQLANNKIEEIETNNKNYLAEINKLKRYDLE